MDYMMNMSRIHRELGYIEGICAGLPEKEAEKIEGAVNEIECQIEEMTQPGRVNDERQGGREIQADTYSHAEMEELTERLYLIARACMEGRWLNPKSVGEDCDRAARVITRLVLTIEDMEYARAAAQP